MSTYITVAPVQESTPGFSFGRSGACAAGTYLLCDQVPSNLAGRLVPFTDATLANIFIVCQNDATVDIEIQKRVANVFTTIYTASLSNQRTLAAQIEDVPLFAGDEIAVVIGSGTVSNVIVGLIIKSSGVG